jgi:hypothetical protein
MRRVLVLAAAGVALAGCASFSLPSLDFFTPAPPIVTLQLDSKPTGATATTSAGPSCQTPCSLQIAAAPGLTVTYTLDRHVPQTITLQTTKHQGAPNFDGTAPIVTDFEPNPVFVELQPAVPPRKMRKPPPRKRTSRAAAQAPGPAATQSQSSAPPMISTPFPPPSQSR